jgi:predicted dehydrogenase
MRFRVAGTRPTLRLLHGIRSRISYKGLIAAMPPGNVVAIALPDQLHFEAVMTAIEHGQHVLCVKPLVLTGCRVGGD